MKNKKYLIPIALVLLIAVLVFFLKPVDSLLIDLPEDTETTEETPPLDTIAVAEPDTTAVAEPDAPAVPEPGTPPVTKPHAKPAPKPGAPPVTKPNYSIIKKKTKQSMVSNLLKGNMAYYVPDSMEVNNPSRVTLTISKNLSIADLKESLEKSIANELNADTSRIVSERIQISKVMTADLYAIDSTALRISRKSRYQQYVHLSDSDTTQTKWEWSVTPLKEGNQNLLIKVSAKIFDGKIEEWIEFEVYNGKVVVKAVPDPDPPNGLETMISYWKENWAWILPTLGALGGFITWLIAGFSRKKTT